MIKFAITWPGIFLALSGIVLDGLIKKFAGRVFSIIVTARKK